ncbi:cyanobactin maturation protease PatG family protein [Geodermatophilus sp. URMC 65]
MADAEPMQARGDDIPPMAMPPVTTAMPTMTATAMPTMTTPMAPLATPPGPPTAWTEEPEVLTTAAAEPPPFVFALGRIEPRFPSLGIEREFAQVLGRGENGGLTDREAMHAVLSDRGNRYLVRQICWVFLIEGLETYIIGPRDPGDFELLVEAVRAAPDRGDVDVVIGERGPVAPPDACNGLTLPLVAFDQLYSFDRDSLIASLPRPEDQDGDDGDRFDAAARELFDRIMQLADNTGSLDEHRALNYLAVRYPGIYAATAEAFGRNESLTGVEVRPSRLSGQRKVFDVILSYTSRETDVTDKRFVRVDVTEKFPFLVSRLAPFYER